VRRRQRARAWCREQSVVNMLACLAALQAKHLPGRPCLFLRASCMHMTAHCIAPHWTPSAGGVEVAEHMNGGGACAPRPTEGVVRAGSGAGPGGGGQAAEAMSGVGACAPVPPRRQGACRGQVEVAKHMSRGLLALVPIFAGCSSPFLDSLSVLLQEARPRPCPPRGALGARPVAARAGVRHCCVADQPIIEHKTIPYQEHQFSACVCVPTHDTTPTSAAGQRWRLQRARYWGRQGAQAPTQARRIDAGARRGGAQAALPDPALNPESSHAQVALLPDVALFPNPTPTQVALPPDTALFRVGDPARELFIVAGGTVDVDFERGGGLVAEATRTVGQARLAALNDPRVPVHASSVQFADAGATQN